MPAPAPTAGPAPNATLTPAGCCAAGAVACPATSGRYSSPATMKDGSPGRPTWPTSSASPATPGRKPTSRAPARCGKAALSCRAWPAAGSAAAGSPCSTTGRPFPLPGYFCTGTGTDSIGARGTRHLRVGGSAIDAAVTGVFLAALAPAALQACLAAAQQARRRLRHRAGPVAPPARAGPLRRDQGLRRYRSVDPENRLVARGLETEWKSALGQLADAGAELARREQARPKTLTAAERAAFLSLGDNLEQVWTAPTTTDKDRKQLLRTLLEEVTVSVHRDDTEGRADLLLRWKGGATATLAVPIRRQPPEIRTDEDTIDLNPGAGRPLPRRPDAASSTGSTGTPPKDCPTPPLESRHCGSATTSPAAAPAATPRKENRSQWQKQPGNWAWSPPP